MPKLPRAVQERAGRTSSRAPRKAGSYAALALQRSQQGERASQAVPETTGVLETLRAGRKPPVRAVVEFTRSLAVMVSARIPVVEALETAARQVEHTALQTTLAGVAERVRSGDSLSLALAQHPEIFSVLYVHLVRVGEVAGLLDQMLLRLAAYLENEQVLRRRLRLAIAYPAVVLAVTVGATAFLLAVIIPTFAEMFADFGAELPAPTLAVIAASDFLRRYALVLALFGIVLVFLVRRVLATDKGAVRWDQFKLRVPVIGTLYRKALTARFCSTLGTLVSSGVPLTEALDVTAGAVNNRVVERVVREMKRRVTRGSSLAGPLETASVFPPMVVQMVAVGEETARLGEMLAHVAGHFETEVDTAVDALTSVIEPVMIVLLGIVLGAILISIYLPMFDLTTAIQ